MGTREFDERQKGTLVRRGVRADIPTHSTGRCFRGNHAPEYLALNPNGLIPCLRDDELVLWESNTIVRYLTAQYGQGSLYPADAKARAGAEKWMDWAISFATFFGPVFINMMRTPPAQRDVAAVEANIERCESLLSIADSALASLPWLSGEDFGVGDIPLGCIAYGWFGMPIVRQSHPHLERWYQQLTTRAAFKNKVMIPLS